MKGFLTWHEQAFRKTRSLVELGAQCVEISRDLEPLLRQAASLTEYATIYRYPGLVAEPTVEEAEHSEAIAREVVDALMNALPLGLP